MEAIYSFTILFFVMFLGIGLLYPIGGVIFYIFYVKGGGKKTLKEYMRDF